MCLHPTWTETETELDYNDSEHCSVTQCCAIVLHNASPHLHRMFAHRRKHGQTGDEYPTARTSSHHTVPQLRFCLNHSLTPAAMEHTHLKKKPNWSLRDTAVRRSQKRLHRCGSDKSPCSVQDDLLLHPDHALRDVRMRESWVCLSPLCVALLQSLIPVSLYQSLLFGR